MKTILLGLIGIMALSSCDDGKEAAAQQEQIKATAVAAGNAEKARFLRETSIPLAEKRVEICRRQVANASSPNELALAEDDLREARRELNAAQADLKNLK